MPYEEITLPEGILQCMPFSTPSRAVTTSPADPGKLPDQLLWSAFKTGDEPAFTKIYNNYSPILYQYGCQYSCDKELVRDCLQDFFLYLRKNRLGFGETNSIRLYLLKAFRRRIFEYLKKSKLRVCVNEPVGLAQFGVELSIEAVYINKQVKAEQLEKLNKALSTLKQLEQKAIYYFYFEGLNYEQIAEIFQFSHVSSARRVMYRGLRQLRGCF
ncbi:MAG: sigma-70 family RNA polymerase sigma factor [Chitinophagaceae bacterium]